MRPGSLAALVRALEEDDVDAARRYLSVEGHHSDGWTNHYSPKYNRCYVAAAYEDVDLSGVRIAFPTYLIDAFERSIVAAYQVGGPIASRACYDAPDRQACEDMIQKARKAA